MFHVRAGARRGHRKCEVDPPGLSARQRRGPLDREGERRSVRRPARRRRRRTRSKGRRSPWCESGTPAARGRSSCAGRPCGRWSRSARRGTRSRRSRDRRSSRSTPGRWPMPDRLPRRRRPARRTRRSSVESSATPIGAAAPQADYRTDSGWSLDPELPLDARAGGALQRPRAVRAAPARPWVRALGPRVPAECAVLLAQIAPSARRGARRRRTGSARRSRGRATTASAPAPRPRTRRGAGRAAGAPAPPASPGRAATADLAPEHDRDGHPQVLRLADARASQWIAASSSGGIARQQPGAVRAARRARRVA